MSGLPVRSRTPHPARPSCPRNAAPGGHVLRHLRYLVVTIAVPALILSVFAVSAVFAGGPAGKSTICHAAAHKFVQITVSNNAVPAHMAHGDVLPDEYGDCPS